MSTETVFINNVFYSAIAGIIIFIIFDMIHIRFGLNQKLNKMTPNELQKDIKITAEKIELREKKNKAIIIFCALVIICVIISKILW